MKLVSVTSQNWRKDLQYVIKALEKGAIVVFPTETAYGLGGDARNKKVIERVNKIKGRPKTKFLPCIASSKSAVKEYFYLSNLERDYIEKKWPGPNTLLLMPKKAKNSLKMDYSEIAIRVSGHECAQYLAKKLGGYIISTSANISGQDSLYSAKKIYDKFKNKKEKPDFIIDWGELKKQKASTIIQFKEGKKHKIR